MDNFISIVIPVYNGEKWIEKCISSIIISNDDFELIVVDDGSVDNTLKIINNIKDSRIKVYSKCNEGPYKTWKFGVSQARGNYILFVDADDYIDYNEIKFIYSIINEYQYDVIQFGNYVEFSSGKIIIDKTNFVVPEGSYIGDDLGKIRHLLLPFLDGKRYPGTRWNKAFRKEPFVNFLEKYSIDNIGDYEDHSVVYPYSRMINSLYVVHTPFYFYHINQTSMSNRTDKSIKYYEDCLKINRYYEENKSVFKFSEDELSFLQFRNFTVLINRCINAKQFKFAKKVIKDQNFSKLHKKFSFGNRKVDALIRLRLVRLVYFFRNMRAKKNGQEKK